MKRTIIQQGSSYTLTLPKKWVESKGLTGSSEVEVTDAQGDLLVQAKSRQTKKELNAKLRAESEPQIRNMLNTWYRLGYDTIHLSFQKEQQAQIISQLIERRFLGFEVTETGKSYLVIENISDPDPEKINTLVRRMFFVVQETFALLEQKDIDAATLQRFLDNTHKYNNYLRRAIVQKQFPEDLSHFYWDVFSRLTLIEYSLSHLYGEVLSKKKVSSRLFPLLSQHYHHLTEQFFQKHPADIEKEQERLRVLLFKDIFRDLQKAKGIIIVYHHYLAELARLLYLLSIPLQALLTQKYSETDEETA